MKIIEAIIRPMKLEAVKNALRQIGIEEFMESSLVCHGRHKGQWTICRGAGYISNIVEKVKLEFFASDDLVARIVDIIGTVARTDKAKDCRISILPLTVVA